MYASQAYVVPFLLYTAWETAAYATPAAAAAGDDLGGFVVIAALFWSVYVSDRGVRTAFDVKTWPARIWFGVLPAGIYLFALAAFIGGIVFGGLGARLEDPPDLANPRRIVGDGFRVEVPGNWGADLDDPDCTLAANPVYIDATWKLWLYEEAIDSRECVDATLANLSETYSVSETARIETWGRFEGAGYRGSTEIEGKPYRLVLFCSTESDRPFEILQISENDTHALVKPGFDQIRDTLELLERE